MQNILTYLAAFFFSLTVPAWLWPERFAPCAYGWRDSRVFSATLWAMLGFLILGLHWVLDLQASKGWTALTVFATMAETFAATIFLYTFRKVQKPLYSSEAERIMAELADQSEDLPPEDRRDLHSRMRKAALAEIDRLAAKEEQERTEGWQENLIHLAVTRCQWEELPERFPDNFPPEDRP